MTSRGRYIPPHLRGPLSGPTNVEMSKPATVVRGDSTASSDSTTSRRSKKSFSIRLPEISPETLLAKVKKGYRTNPERFRELHRSLFPVLPKKVLDKLYEERSAIKPPRPRFYGDKIPSVPIQILESGNRYQVFLHSLTQQDRERYLALTSRIDSIHASYKKRVANVPNIIEKLSQKKLERWTQRHSSDASKSIRTNLAVVRVVSSETISTQSDFESLDKEYADTLEMELAAAKEQIREMAAKQLSQPLPLSKPVCREAATQTDIPTEPSDPALAKLINQQKEQNLALQQQISRLQDENCELLEILERRDNTVHTLKIQDLEQQIRDLEQQLKKEYDHNTDLLAILERGDTPVEKKKNKTLGFFSKLAPKKKN